MQERVAGEEERTLGPTCLGVEAEVTAWTIALPPDVIEDVRRALAAALVEQIPTLAQETIAQVLRQGGVHVSPEDTFVLVETDPYEGA